MWGDGMTGSIIIGVLAGVFSLFCLKEAAGYRFDWLDWILSGVLAVIIGGGALFCVFLFSLAADTHPEYNHSKDIYSVADGSEVKGAFTLGTGSVDEKQYFYFVKSDGAGKRIDKIEVDATVIYEMDKEKPKIEFYDERYTSAFARFMFGEYSGSHSYKLFVPENTITKEYNIDLE